jgi:hypothetical protein
VVEEEICDEADRSSAEEEGWTPTRSSRRQSKSASRSSRDTTAPFESSARTPWEPRKGKPHVLAYQIAGESTSGLPPEGEWRCFDVDKLSDLAASPGVWRTAPNLFNPQSCLDDVDLVVQPLPPR